jgi:hypothetical protein
MNYDIKYYILGFIVFVGAIQLFMNIWASRHLCQTDKKKTPNLNKALLYTLIPWIIILCLTSVILYMMPGWVRIFSNTIGVSVIQSVYSSLFTLDKPNTGEKLSDIIHDIYRDPSKIINEVEYLAGFKNWYDNIFFKYLKDIHYFDNDVFKIDNIDNIPHTHMLYQLYLCVSLKEKIGYFTWLFLLGIIFVLVSLCQMYESDC